MNESRGTEGKERRPVEEEIIGKIKGREYTRYAMYNEYTAVIIK